MSQVNFLWQTDGRTDEWVLMSPVFAKARGTIKGNEELAKLSISYSLRFTLIFGLEILIELSILQELLTR